MWSSLFFFSYGSKFLSRKTAPCKQKKKKKNSLSRVEENWKVLGPWWLSVTRWQQIVLKKNLSGPHSTHVVHARSLQPCPTLCDPMDCSQPGSSLRGILQARILEWVAMPFSRESSQPRVEPMFLTSPALAGGFVTTSATWEAPSGQFKWPKPLHNLISIQQGFKLLLGKDFSCCLGDTVSGGIKVYSYTCSR